MTAPLPQAWGVLYAHPNPDGSRKKCQNCVMFVLSEGGRCVIHPRDLRIMRTQVCGYHVFGNPKEVWVDHPGIQSVDPQFSGLSDPLPDGTSCDVCRFYKKTDERTGFCYAVASGNKPPAGDVPTPVLAKACCARWEGLEDQKPEEPKTESQKLADFLRKLVVTEE